MTRTITEDALGRLSQALSQARRRIGQLSYSNRPISPAFAAQVAETLGHIERELLSLPTQNPKDAAPVHQPAGKL